MHADTIEKKCAEHKNSKSNCFPVSLKKSKMNSKVLFVKELKWNHYLTVDLILKCGSILALFQGSSLRLN